MTSLHSAMRGVFDVCQRRSTSHPSDPGRAQRSKPFRFQAGSQATTLSIMPVGCVSEGMLREIVHHHLCTGRKSAHEGRCGRTRNGEHGRGLRTISLIHRVCDCARAWDIPNTVACDVQEAKVARLRLRCTLLLVVKE